MQTFKYGALSLVVASVVQLGPRYDDVLKCYKKTRAPVALNILSRHEKWKNTTVATICILKHIYNFPNRMFSMEALSCRRNLLNVLDFLKRPNASTLVSGTRDRVNLHDKFKNAIEISFPGTIDELVLKVEEKAAQQRKLSFWESVADTKVGAFKFSF